jgi:hypothetical protein
MISPWVCTVNLSPLLPSSPPPLPSPPAPTCTRPISSSARPSAHQSSLITRALIHPSIHPSLAPHLHPSSMTAASPHVAQVPTFINARAGGSVLFCSDQRTQPTSPPALNIPSGAGTLITTAHDMYYIRDMYHWTHITYPCTPWAEFPRWDIGGGAIAKDLFPPAQLLSISVTYITYMSPGR